MLSFYLISLAMGEEEVNAADLYDTIVIPNGRYTMGCTNEKIDKCDNDEFPARKVTITRPFEMMKSEVTQELYEEILGSNPSHFTSCGENCPVDSVSWYDSIAFANALSEREGLPECYIIKPDNVQPAFANILECKGWRLPTEAEWEYAARGGKRQRYAGSQKPYEIAWYSDNSESTTQPVCSKNTNNIGLCDMSGNVFEWVWDYWDDSTENYSNISNADPLGAEQGQFRIYRGGSWFSDAWYSRTSFRSRGTPKTHSVVLGFRLVKTTK
jgi:formylglycine-generating enzyme required for sulfatase activity